MKYLFEKTEDEIIYDSLNPPKLEETEEEESERRRMSGDTTTWSFDKLKEVCRQAQLRPATP